MSIQITPNIPKLAFSSEIPDFVILSQAERVTTSLFIDRQQSPEFEVDLFTVGGCAVLYDVRTIIEMWLGRYGLSYCTFRVEATSSDGFNEATTSTGDIYCIYCDRHLFADATEWLTCNFLSTLKSKMITRSLQDRLYYFFDAAKESHLLRYSFTFRTSPSDSPKTIAWEEPAPTDTATGIHHLEISHSSLKELCEYYNAEVGDITLLAVKISLGKRTFTYYFNDIDPNLTIAFCNCFNIPELAEITATTVTKSKVERESAVANGTVSFYNRQVTKSHEVTTAPLSIEEFQWLEQLVSSPLVRLIDRRNHLAQSIDDHKEIIITESTCESTDDATQLSRLKFTWQYPSLRPVMSSPYFNAARHNPDFFTEEFSQQFK